MDMTGMEGRWVKPYRRSVMQIKLNKNRGFTLIELLVVIAIIGVEEHLK